MYKSHLFSIAFQFKNEQGLQLTNLLLGYFNSGKFTFTLTDKDGKSFNIHVSYAVLAPDIICAYIDPLEPVYSIDLFLTLIPNILYPSQSTSSEDIPTEPALGEGKYVYTKNRYDMQSSLERAESMAETTQTYSGSRLSQGQIPTAGFLIIASFDLSNLLVRLAQLMKFIDRIKFVNLDFKPILNAFFLHVGDVFKPSGALYSSEDIPNDRGVRGKFELYRVGIDAYRILNLNIILYILSWILFRIFAIIPDERLLNRGVMITVIKIHQRIHCMLYTMYSIDYYFYCTRSFLHTNIPSVSSHYLVSWSISTIVLTCLSIDLWMIIDIMLDWKLWGHLVRYELITEKYHAMLNADGSVRGYAFRRVKPDNTATSPLPKSKNASKFPIPVPKVSGLTIYSKIPLDDGQKKGKMGDGEGPLIFAGSRKQLLFSTDTVLPKEEGRSSISGLLPSRKPSEMGIKRHTNGVQPTTSTSTSLAIASSKTILSREKYQELSVNPHFIRNYMLVGFLSSPLRRDPSVFLCPHYRVYTLLEQIRISLIGCLLVSSSPHPRMFLVATFPLATEALLGSSHLAARAFFAFLS